MRMAAKRPRFRRLAFLLGLCLCVAAAAANQPLSIIRIGGSDTMLILTRLWAESYMSEHPGVSVYAESGGTATGVRNLIREKIDICAASRPLRPEEVQKLAERHRSVGLVFTVAKEALCIYLHPQNPVQDLSVGQLKELFTGRIRNWAEVGGTRTLVVPLIRPHSSGTHLYFKEHVLDDEEYSRHARVVTDTRKMAEGISANPNAIGYGGTAYGSGLHAKVNGISPTLVNIQDGTYPLTRYLYLMTVSTPRGEVKEFIDWVLSPAGQKLVGQAGYVPLWETDRPG